MNDTTTPTSIVGPKCLNAHLLAPHDRAASPLTPISTSFLFVFDTEWVMSTCEHQGRDAVLQTGLESLRNGAHLNLGAAQGGAVEGRARSHLS